mgnify:CR=1 FL=1
MAKKRSKKKQPKVHEDLKGFEININEFGEIKTSYNANTINDFLNKNVVDKKLKGLEDTEPLNEDKNEEEDNSLFNE